MESMMPEPWWVDYAALTVIVVPWLFALLLCMRFHVEPSMYALATTLVWSVGWGWLGICGPLPVIIPFVLCVALKWSEEAA